MDVPFARVFAGGMRSRSTCPSRTSRSRRERAKSVDFSAPYFVVNKGVLVAPGFAPPTTLAELRSSGLRPDRDDQHAVRPTASSGPTRAPHSFPSPIDALRALSDGFCQAMVADLEILVAARRDEPDLYGPIAGQIVTDEHYGAVFEKGSKLRGRLAPRCSSLARSRRRHQAREQVVRSRLGPGARPQVKIDD